MKRLVGFLVSAVFLFGVLTSAYASDWDVAGKVLTGITGLRILTGGKVDIIGAITGSGRARDRKYAPSEPRHYSKVRQQPCKRVWVAHYVWKKEWVPEHTEFDNNLGEVVVEGHYIRYKVESGGYWEYECKHKGHKHS